jgi:hypothetical protein
VVKNNFNNVRGGASEFFEKRAIRCGVNAVDNDGVSFREEERSARCYRDRVRNLREFKFAEIVSANLPPNHQRAKWIEAQVRDEALRIDALYPIDESERLILGAAGSARHAGSSHGVNLAKSSASTAATALACCTIASDSLNDGRNMGQTESS